MDVVLGLSLTSAAVRWVLVEGTTGEGAPVDRGSLPVEHTLDANALLDQLLGTETTEYQVHAVGVSWAPEAEAGATAVMAALEARQLDNVVAISDVEAVDALAWGSPTSPATTTSPCASWNPMPPWWPWSTRAA